MDQFVDAANITSVRSKKKNVQITDNLIVSPPIKRLWFGTPGVTICLL